jgi:hypothetical protein
MLRKSSAATIDAIGRDRGGALAKSRSKSMYLPQSSFEQLQHNTTQNGKTTVEKVSSLAFGENDDDDSLSADPAPESRGMARARSASVRFASSSAGTDRVSTASPDVSRGSIQKSKSARFFGPTAREEVPTSPSASLATTTLKRSTSVRFSSGALASSVDSATTTASPRDTRRASLQLGGALSLSSVTAEGRVDSPSGRERERRRSVSSVAAGLFSQVGADDNNRPLKKDSNGTYTCQPLQQQVMDDGEDEDATGAITSVDFDTMEEGGLGSAFRDDILSVLQNIGVCVWDIKSAQDRLMGSVHYFRNDERLSGFVTGVSEESGVTSDFLEAIRERLVYLESSTEAFVNRLDVVLLDKKDLERELDDMQIEQHRITETELHTEKMKLIRETERQAAAIANLTKALDASRQEVAVLGDRLRDAEELEASHSLETYYLNQGRVDLEKKYEKLKKKYAKLDKASELEDKNGRERRSPSVDLTAQSQIALAQATNLAEMHEKEMERVYRKCSELKTKFIKYRARVDVRGVTHTNALLMEQMTRMNLENDVSHANKVIATLRRQIAQLEESKKHAQSQVRLHMPL